jgi:hypothetical protein
MRALVLYAVMLLSYECVAQSGSPAPGFDFAGAHLSQPGTYSMPFTPLLETPNLNLSQPSLQVGASNSTGNNSSGAQNSTMSVLPQSIGQPLITPRLAGAPISYDLYPKASYWKATY